MSQEKKPLPFIYQFAAGNEIAFPKTTGPENLSPEKTRRPRGGGCLGDLCHGMPTCLLPTPYHSHFGLLFATSGGAGIVPRSGHHSKCDEVESRSLDSTKLTLPKYPLDTVKTRQQLATGKSAGIISTLSDIVKNEGFARIYRGITAPVLMEAPKRAIKFAANDEWGKVYRKAFGQEKMTQGLSVLTGATAGATESFVVVPFELVKIRLQNKASAHLYSGPVDVLTKVIKNEGLLAMYQGLESTMHRHILWNAGYFGCIFQVRQMLPAAESKAAKLRNDIVAGTVGGTVGTILNTPMDVVKSRVQNSPRVPGVAPKYNWAYPALATVAKEEGFGALYRGFLPKVLRLGPGGGILLVVFTQIIELFEKMRDGK